MTTKTCTWSARDDVFEGYVRDALEADDREAFEAHYFECAACFDKLETYRALHAELRAAPAEAPAVRVVPARLWRWALVPAAAGIVAVAAIALWPRGQAPETPESTTAVAPTPRALAPAPAAQAPPVSQPAGPASAGRQAGPRPASPPVVALSVLARVEPPVYIPMTLRGPRDEAAEKFDAAMRRYTDGDYAGAIPELDAAADLNPKSPRTAFFLAICNLVTDQLESAVSGLQKTIALGDSPYLEEAHFYLAKARLRQGDVPAARQELVRTIERHGRLQPDARRLLAQVEALGARK